MFGDDKVIEIYCLADDFCKLFDEQMKKYSISDTRKPASRKYYRDSSMSEAGIMTIMILFHASSYRYNFEGRVMYGEIQPALQNLFSKLYFCADKTKFRLQK